MFYTFSKRFSCKADPRDFFFSQIVPTFVFWSISISYNSSRNWRTEYQISLLGWSFWLLVNDWAINGKTNTNPPGSSHGEQLVENRLTLDHIVLTKNAMVIPFLFPSDDTCESEQIVSYTSWNCPGGREQSDSSWCDKFPASNILSLDVDQWGENYWISEEKKTGEEQGFILYLGCSKTVRGVSLKNTPNKGFWRRGRILNFTGSVHSKSVTVTILKYHCRCTLSQKRTLN